MKERLLGFVDLLRRAGVNPGPGEIMDAFAAVAAAGVDRSVLRECLAAALVKDHADRPTFDEAFDRYFALPVPDAKRRKRPRPSNGGEGTGGAGAGSARGPQRQGGSPAPSGEPQDREKKGERQPRDDRGRLLARRRALLAKPFLDMDARDVEETRELLAALGQRYRRRVARRARGARRGRFDMRRTVRRALSRGGVPIEILLRRPRPGKTDLVALVDLSFSTAAAADFLLGVLAPARSYFRRVCFLGYVDRPAEIFLAGGHAVPHEPLDVNARSDFGQVLCRLRERRTPLLGRNTVLLVLGDARNNRRPPRADLLARMRREVRAVVWLNPDPPERWDTGDSVMASYARHVDLLLAASTPRALLVALTRVARLTVR